MEEQQNSNEYTLLVSDSYGNEKEKGIYEVAFRRWLVRELDGGRMTVGDAIERFNFIQELQVILFEHGVKNMLHLLL